jgi:repressor LexA
VLTWRQRKVLQVIRESVQQRGYPPSMREIGEAVGLASTSSVSYQLSALQCKGYLHRDISRARSVEVHLPSRPAMSPDQETPPAGFDLPSQDPIYVPQRAARDPRRPRQTRRPPVRRRTKPGG